VFEGLLIFQVEKELREVDPAPAHRAEEGFDRGAEVVILEHARDRVLPRQAARIGHRLLRQA